MKRITIIAILALTVLSANAQPGQMPPGRPDDGNIIRMQSMDIAELLDLDEKTEDRFIKEYTAFRKEIDAVAKKAMPSKGTDTESDIDKTIRQNFETSEKIIEIRKEYYERFKKFLKPSQIRMMYLFENEAGRRMRHDPGRPGGPDGPGEPGEPGEPRPF